jgi:hypothetical protein
MITFIDEILADVEWRISELATIKSLPIKYSFRPEHKELQIKYSVPAIYSIWEGFIKSTFTIYSEHLNSLSITRNEISYNLLTHQLDSECNFNNPRTAFETKRKLVEKIDIMLSDVVTIKPCVPTESNVNLKVLNRILERFCIDPVDEKNARGLDKLLMFRNKISHGENAINVTMTNITEFIKIIENLMLDILINIEHSEKTMTYKK